MTEILVILELKAKSIWSSKKIIGEGIINLLQLGENKCFLNSGEENSGIVYFKFKYID